MKQETKITAKNHNLYNKRHLRADGLSLLPSALRPRLLGDRRQQNSGVISPQFYNTEKTEQNGSHFRAILAYNRFEKRQNLAKIVVASTILLGFSLFLANFSTPVSALSLTLSVPTEALSLQIQPNNTFTKSSPASVSVKTDAFAGYTLSLKAKTDNNLTSGTNKIASIASNLTEEQYKSSGNTNTWGYLPSKINSGDNSSFLPGPTTSPSTIESTKTRNDTANNYNITLGAKTDSTIPNGTYSNTFVFSATANTVSYSITYNLNQGSWNGTSPQTGSTVESSINLDSHTPTRSSYTFNGWCSLPTSSDSCSGEIYQAGDDYPLTSGSNTVTLYAIWISSSGCFAAGTLVDTPEGLKPIEDIEAGMTIYSYDTNEDKIKEDVVEEVYSHPSGQVVKLTFNDGYTIQGTSWHFIYNLSEGSWDPLGIYQSGDTIQSLNGLDHHVNSVEPVSGQRHVYNLQTKPYNNFIIATSQNNKFLVIGAFAKDIKQEEYYPSILRAYGGGSSGG